MAQLAIKGHATRGKEVIEILEMFGGINTQNLYGDENYAYYTIDSDKEIKAGIYVFGDEKLSSFTLEKFLKKFPYKVGDKVQHKGATSCGSVFEVEKMHWEGDTVMYTLCLFGCNYKRSTLPAEYLQPYKEETMEGKITMNEDEGTLVAIDLTMDFRKADDIEVILGDYEFVLKDGKTYFVKRYKYPKTYEECCKILNIPVNGDIVYAGNWSNGGEYLDKHLDILRDFQKLLICRDAYWKIAGEQMRLGKPWEPDYTDGNVKYIIGVHRNHLDFNCTIERNYILIFPTEEMRDAFYENFKELIEQCKELL